MKYQINSDGMKHRRLATGQKDTDYDKPEKHLDG
jgi:hypothetical protein